MVGDRRSGWGVGRGVVILRVQKAGQGYLLLIAHANNEPGLIFRLAQGREQHRHQDGDDGDHH